MARIKFYSSQIGGISGTAHSHTESPLLLLRRDVTSALGSYLFLPFILWPLSPYGSNQLCELYPSTKNLWAMFLHLVLFLLQAPLILSVPFWLFFPLGWLVLALALFGLVNRGLSWLLNGSEIKMYSNPKYAVQREEHKHERWIFLNGVAVGKHWLQSNIDRLALTFRRPILGVHNPTTGILFDVLQCLVQRTFNYATLDIRAGYDILKDTLYDPSLTKVVFILHSQGAIEGGMIIDWLLQEVPQDLLAKLEVYTFGNAANHFNNPHLYLLSQQAAMNHPERTSTTTVTTHVQSSPDSNPSPRSNPNQPHLPTPTATSTSTSSPSNGKTLRYIEHYAQTSDFVARWGVLHFACNPSPTFKPPRFMGRIFEQAGKGHQFNQHYLDTMFPLQRAAGSGDGGHDLSWKAVFGVKFWRTGDAGRAAGNGVEGGEGGNANADENGIGDSGFDGADERPGKNAFMDAEIEWMVGGVGSAAGTGPGTGTATDEERETMEVSYAGAHGESIDAAAATAATATVTATGAADSGERTLVNGVGAGNTIGVRAVNGSGNEELPPREFQRDADIMRDQGGMRVKDLSRLWLYVNGKSPKADEVDLGIPSTAAAAAPAAATAV